MVPGVKFSVTTSAHRAILSTSSLALGWRMDMATPCLLEFMLAK